MKKSMLLVMALFLGFFFIHAGAADAYTSIHKNFKGDYTPEKVRKSGKISALHKGVPKQFKAFIPPGATKATMIIYGPQRKIVGVAARVGNPPQCRYPHMSEKKAEYLPWKKPNSGTFDFMKSNDFQTNMVDGQIEIFHGDLAPP